jgi:type I restriction enzyme M protein
MPAGVFRPYAGVSTAVLVFTKGAATDRIWFYDIEHDGFSLDDKRQRVAENDIADLLECWQNRNNADFEKQRTSRLTELREQIAPLKANRLQHQAAIHRLKFEVVVADEPEAASQARGEAESELATLQAEIQPFQEEINQLTRQFWVAKDQVVANKFDLSANRYRLVEQDDTFFEQPAVTIDRLRQLGSVAQRELAALAESLR